MGPRTIRCSGCGRRDDSSGHLSYGVLVSARRARRYRPRRLSAWTCQRVTAGETCRHKNPSRKRKCAECGKARPARRRPKHLAALDASYEEYVALNGGEQCGICGATQKEGGKRLHRDHDHRTGRARGLLCFRCNAALRPYMTLEWLRAAVEYLQRTEVA
jgi:hypothetical protein